MRFLFLKHIPSVLQCGGEEEISREHLLCEHDAKVNRKETECNPMDSFIDESLFVKQKIYSSEYTMVAIKAILIHRRLKKKTTHKTVKGTSIRLFFCFISCSPSLFFPYFSFSENSVVNRTKSFCFSVELGKSVKITRGRHNALYCCVQRPFAIHSHLMLFCEP